MEENIHPSEKALPADKQEEAETLKQEPTLKNKKPQSSKEAQKNSLEESFISGAKEDESIDLYKEQLAQYSVLQLKNILRNIDQEQFPLRSQVIKEMLAQKNNPADEIKTPKPETIKEKAGAGKSPDLIKKITGFISSSFLKELYSNQERFLKFCLIAIIIILLISLYFIIMIVIHLPGKNIIEGLL